MTRDFGVNAGLVSELAGMYLHDRASVDEQWRAYFDSLLGEGKARPIEARADLHGQAGVSQLINAYRVRGHLLAQIDPLGLLMIEAPPAMIDFHLETFGLSDADLDSEFDTGDMRFPDGRTRATLREIVERMRATYCRSIGVEWRDIEEPELRNWLRDRMESTGNRLALGPDMQRRILTRLTEAESFETFVHKNFINAKRFSLQGAESLIPMLDLMVESAAEHGGEEIVLGMAHRGRLNVLVNFMEKGLGEILAAFIDAEPERNLGSGDVKYHLGHSVDRITSSGRKVHLTLAFNPSHLEWVNPVVEGRVRAKQDRRKDRERRAVIPLLIHGDAAFVGQGVNSETLNLAGLEGYKTGGTLHVIINNQVGFTTNPRDSRSTRYATDLAHMLHVPVFHVNGEDLEAVAHVTQMAVEYRQRFGADVVVDLYCYRRYGHNEGDEPRYTQPVMYAVIDKKPTIREIFARQVVESGSIPQAEVDALAAETYRKLGEALESTRKGEICWVPHSMGGVWSPYRGGRDAFCPEVDTSVPAEQLISLARKLVEIPDGFTPNRKVHELWLERQKKIEAGDLFDWGTGEVLAYASLLAEGTPVRLSGQDVRRGTFTHRHAVLIDREYGARYCPFDRVAEKGARMEVWDSPLSEAGVLGFDYGYSLDYPDALVLWEAQFGDFVNTAQVIIDQFISSAEDKWKRLSGLVMLLPHAYEGQGPEHSNARLNRFVSLCAEDDMQVCNLTTPAQLFHVLRRQVRRAWRKPLIIMTPKSGLRIPKAASPTLHPASSLDDLSKGAFQRVIPDAAGISGHKARKILLCTGHVYYDLVNARHKRGIEDVAIVRLEQIYPLDGTLDKVLAPYKDGTPLVWVQEEPWNMGVWFFINARLGDHLRERFPLSCVAREESASPATGSKASHELEQATLVDQALA
jgi:2-oxoglutarate dehydrogenase E1 component